MVLHAYAPCCGNKFCSSFASFCVEDRVTGDHSARCEDKSCISPALSFVQECQEGSTLGVALPGSQTSVQRCESDRALPSTRTRRLATINRADRYSHTHAHARLYNHTQTHAHAMPASHTHTSNTRRQVQKHVRRRAHKYTNARKH